jgi:diguanylate cyclase (GGDEF)-like protein
MSIYRQLWLAIIGLTILSFTGSFAVSVYTARKYIEQQLYMKNVDNAGSLALVLSQLPSKDLVTVELVISAQFDTGHYQEIVLTDPKHQVLVDKHYTGNENGSPIWFEQLFPLQADAGVALVQDGWKQFGSIRVVSHSRFAYQALWTGIKELATWFILAGLIAGVMGTWLLRLLFQPLNRVVEQAQAIHERRFITVPEPTTPELRSVVVAMNAMVERLKNMFSEEADRLDSLRRQVNHDPLTNLPNRSFFMTWLQEALQGDEALAGGGSLALVRITNLEQLNTRLGHKRTDQLIQTIASTLQELVPGVENRLAARLNGADFAVLAAGDNDTDAFMEKVCSALRHAMQAHWAELDDVFHVGAVQYQKSEKISDLLAASDKALAIAENKGSNSCHSLNVTVGADQNMSCEIWRQTLTQALGNGRIRLERYPVLASGGQAIHQEGAARLQLQPDGPWLSAGEFMPMVLRLKLSSAVDMDALHIALDHLTTEATEIAVNLSADSITDWGFRDAMIDVLKQNPDQSRRLWIEVPEYGAFRNFEAFRSFCLNLSSLGCKLGIEHFGQHLGEIAKLAELGLDYLKIDSRYVRDISQNAGNREFLQGLCKMAHNVGLIVIAEGVSTEQELATLIELGFDGATGQAVTQRTKG